VARIGINARNIITEEKNIFDDWVNTAACLERFAGPSGSGILAAE
jgi:class 3 adenylate cyclase